MKRSVKLFGTVIFLLYLSSCSQALNAIPTLINSATSRPQISATPTPVLTPISSKTPRLTLASESSLVQASLTLPESAKAWQLPDAQIWDIAYSPDGRYLVVASREVMIYQMDRLELWAKIPKSTGIQSVAWSLDGQRLAGGSSDGMLWVWDMTTQNELARLKTDFTSIDSLAWSPDGQLLAAQLAPNKGEGGILRVWNVATEEESIKLDLGNNYYSRVAWSPDGTQLAGGYSQYSWITLWNAATGEKQLSLSGLPDMITWVNSLAWSPNGKWLASGLGSATPGQISVVIYDPVTGERQRILAVSTDPEQVRGVETDPGVYHSPCDVDAVAWSPDSRFLASGSYNGMLNLWDISTGKVLASLDNIGAGKSATWSPDGKTLAIGTYEGILILWDVSQFLR